MAATWYMSDVSFERIEWLCFPEITFEVYFRLLKWSKFKRKVKIYVLGFRPNGCPRRVW